jgi:hypothetical protein
LRGLSAEQSGLKLVCGAILTHMRQGPCAHWRSDGVGGEPITSARFSKPGWDWRTSGKYSASGFDSRLVM